MKNVKCDMSERIENAHISSLIVHCDPEKLTEIKGSITDVEYTEVALHDAAGKLVLVLETETEQEILSIIEHIQNLPGVLAATMVYHELDFQEP